VKVFIEKEENVCKGCYFNNEYNYQEVICKICIEKKKGSLNISNWYNDLPNRVRELEAENRELKERIERFQEIIKPPTLTEKEIDRIISAYDDD